MGDPINVTLEPGAKVGGRVLEKTSGLPLARAEVTVRKARSFYRITSPMELDGRPAGPELSTTEARKTVRVQTDDDGFFEVGELAAGDYEVSAAKERLAGKLSRSVRLAAAEYVGGLVIEVESRH